MGMTVLLSAMLSCNSEMDIPSPEALDDIASEEVVWMDLTLDASLFPETRTTYDEEGNGLKTRWEANDAIGLFVEMIVKTTQTNASGAATVSTSTQLMGFPLTASSLSNDGRIASFSGSIPAYMKQVSGRITTEIQLSENGVATGIPVLAVYPLTAESTLTNIDPYPTGSGSVSISVLGTALSIANQAGLRDELKNSAIMSASGTLKTVIVGSGQSRTIRGSLDSPLSFKQDVALLHLSHVFIGTAGEIGNPCDFNMTLTLSGDGIGSQAAVSSSGVSATAGAISLTLTAEDVFDVDDNPVWSDELGRYVLPEDCGKGVLFNSSDCDMDGGAFYLEDVYFAFLPKNFQAGTQLKLHSSSGGKVFEYIWNARTAYEPGKVYHLRDKAMSNYQTFQNGDALVYFNEDNAQYRYLQGETFKIGDEKILYVRTHEDFLNLIHGSDIPFWESSNEAVVRVDNGRMVCLKGGTATITATDAEGHSASSTITVSQSSFDGNDYLTANIPEEDMILSANKPVALVFQSETLQLEVRKNDGSISYPKDYTWYVGPNRTADVSVDENGLVTRLSSGEAEICARDKNGEIRRVIVAAQDSNPGLVFCDEDRRRLKNNDPSNGFLSLSKSAYGRCFAFLYVKPGEDGDKFETVSSLNSSVNYLTMEKVEDIVGNVAFGDVVHTSFISPTYPPYRNVFYSGDAPAMSLYKVSYNGPHGKVSLDWLYVIHDTVQIYMDALPTAQSYIDPVGGEVAIQVVAHSYFNFPIEWKMVSPSWSDYDPGQGPLKNHDAPWTTPNVEPCTVIAQIPMKKTGEVHSVYISLQASTAGNRGGTITTISLFPTIASASLEAIPVKHDSVTENINLEDYVEWRPSTQILSLGAGCGFVQGANSSRTKVGAELKLLYRGRNNAWLDLATSPLTSHVTVSTSCDAGFYFDAYNFYHSNIISEVLYAVRRPSSTVSGHLYITDGLGYRKSAMVLVYPDKVP